MPQSGSGRCLTTSGNQGIEVVMYGSSHIEANGKGEPKVAVQDVAKVAKQHVQALITPEQNTIKLCAECWKAEGRRI